MDPVLAFALVALVFSALAAAGVATELFAAMALKLSPALKRGDLLDLGSGETAVVLRLKGLHVLVRTPSGDLLTIPASEAMQANAWRRSPP